MSHLHFAVRRIESRIFLKADCSQSHVFRLRVRQWRDCPLCFQKRKDSATVHQVEQLLWDFRGCKNYTGLRVTHGEVVGRDFRDLSFFERRMNSLTFEC